MAGIRDIETRLSKEEQWFNIPKPKPTLSEPAQGVKGKDEIRLMYDIMVAALQTDSTRVLTFRQPVRDLLTSIGVNVHQHDMSHYHQTKAEKLDASERRDKAQSELLSGLLDKLKATKEADGSSLFDHTKKLWLNLKRHSKKIGPYAGTGQRSKELRHLKNLASKLKRIIQIKPTVPSNLFFSLIINIISNRKK